MLLVLVLLLLAEKETVRGEESRSIDHLLRRAPHAVAVAGTVVIPQNLHTFFKHLAFNFIQKEK